MDDRPRVAVTLGDVAGVGPEIALQGWSDPELHAVCRPLVIGDRGVLERVKRRLGGGPELLAANAEPGVERMPVLDVEGLDLAEIEPGRIDAQAGRAAYEFLNKGIDLALAGEIDAIVTLPLQKEALHAAGVRHPGHTEILAEKCGVRDFAMMLYLPPGVAKGESGLGVLHATLHVALREVFELLTPERIGATIRLADEALRPLTGGRQPRVAVAGLNPHAGEGGLFGDEEIRLIGPAVETAQRQGIDVVGPIAADTLFARAVGGEFDAVVAMYHDQGHCAIKTIGFEHAVNVTLGLPIVRTSVAHGTAFDIAWQGKADPTSFLEAARVAGRIVAGRKRLSERAGLSGAGS